MALQPLIGSDLKLHENTGVTGVLRVITATGVAGILVPANLSRSMLMIFNNIASGTTYIVAANQPNQPVVSGAYFTTALLPLDYWEMPVGVTGIYKGPVFAVCSGTGTINVTEHSET